MATTPVKASERKAPKAKERQPAKAVSRTARPREEKVWRMVILDPSTRSMSVRNFQTIADLRTYAYSPESGIAKQKSEWREDIDYLYPKNDRSFIEWFIERWQDKMGEEDQIFFLYGSPTDELIY